MFSYKVFSIILLCFQSAASMRNYYSDIDRFEYEFNPVFSNITSELKKNANNVTNQNINFEVRKDLARKVFVSFTFDFQDHDGIYKPAYKLSRINLCEILGNGKVVRNPLLNTILSMVRKFGRIPLSCPIKKGHYFIKNFKIDPKYSPPVVFYERVKIAMLTEHMPGKENIWLGAFRWFLVNKSLN